jgi:mitochondrial fission protein ELM1
MPLTLRIWRFTDGRPGHEKQTAGLLQGFRECLPHDAGTDAEIDVRDIALADYAHDWSALWRDPGEAPDLLIGAGRRTHLPMARTRWHLGSRAIVLMKPSLPSFCYDLALVPEHDSTWSERKVLRTLGMLGPRESGTKASDRGVILLGGMNDHFHWRDAEIAEAVANIVRQSPDVHWQISDSPRSSEGLVGAVVAALAGAPKARVLRYTDNPPDWLTQALANASQVWVSADSASMLYEALSSGGHVGVIELTSKRRRNKLLAGIDALRRQRRVGLSSAGALLDQGLEPEPLQEHRRCAEWILARWFS